MSAHKEHKNSWIKNFLDYLSDKMTGRQRNSFEKDLERDAFEAEAFEGLSSLSENELSEDLNFLQNKLQKRTRRKSGIPYLRIAAGFAILAVMSVSFFLVFDKEMKNTPDYSLGESVPEKDKGIIDDTVSPPTRIEEDLSEVSNLKEQKKVSDQPAEKNGEKAKPEEFVEKDLGLLDEDLATETIATTETIETTAPTVSEEPRPAAEIESLEEMAIEQDMEIQVTNAERSRSKSAVPAGLSKMSAKKSDSNIKNDVLRGKVISAEDSMPIPGALIRIKGKDAGILTDLEGNFELEATEHTEFVVLASMLGMIEEEVIIDTSGLVQIVMHPDELSLGETISVGYGAFDTSKDKEDTELFTDEPETGYSSAYPLEGFAEFKKYIDNNLVFPEEIHHTDRAVIILMTTIDPAGNPTQIRIVKSPDEAFSQEAKSLIESGPRWIPSKKDGEYFEEETRIRIVFKR